MPLTETQRADVARRVAEAEARTGAQIVAAVVARSDSYPEVPWRAFSLGASVGALVGLSGVVLAPGTPSLHAALLVAAVALGAGAALATAATLVPALARALLDGHRVEGEVRQRAEGLFLANEVFRTEHRVGVLLMASEFERRVVVLADRGVRERVPREELDAVVAAMLPALRTGRTADAFAAGIGALEALLAGRSLAHGPSDGLPDSVVRGDAS